MSSTVSTPSIVMFLGVIAISLAITYWAARRSHTRSQLYAAGGKITAWQNGFAIAGDLLSAATVLGGVGMFFMSGYDTNIYFFASMAGFLLMLGLVAGPLRKLGRFTFADVTAVRLSPVPIRVFAAISALAVILMYLISQMIGAGGLIEILFGIPYSTSVIIVGVLMITYVSFGGMLATTWVQVVKAILLVFALAFLSFLALAEVGFNLDTLYAKASSVHSLGRKLFQPGGMNMGPVAVISLAIALAFGIPGMPHILMRFFTVPSPVVARRSLVIGMLLIASIYALIFVVIGAASVAFVMDNPMYINETGAVRGGSNMVAIHLANYLGGDLLMGLIAAVAFATILAVVAGLTVAAAGAIAYDIYGNVFARGKSTERKETLIFRASSVGIGVLAIGLGIAFEGQNIIYLTGMLYGIAASACFPVLIMSIYWPRLTTVGAISGGTVGLISSVGIIIMGPNIWVQVLGNASPIFNLDQPAIISVPAAFLVMITVSLMTKERQLMQVS